MSKDDSWRPRRALRPSDTYRSSAWFRFDAGSLSSPGLRGPDAGLASPCASPRTPLLFHGKGTADANAVQVAPRRCRSADTLPRAAGEASPAGAHATPVEGLPRRRKPLACGPKDASRPGRSPPPEQPRSQRRHDFLPASPRLPARRVAEAATPAACIGCAAGGASVSAAAAASPSCRAASPGSRWLHQTSHETAAALMPDAKPQPQASPMHIQGRRVATACVSSVRPAVPQTGPAAGPPQPQSPPLRDHRSSDMVRELWAGGPASIVNTSVPVVYAACPARGATASMTVCHVGASVGNMAPLGLLGT